MDDDGAADEHAPRAERAPEHGGLADEGVARRSSHGAGTRSPPPSPRRATPAPCPRALDQAAYPRQLLASLAPRIATPREAPPSGTNTTHRATDRPAPRLFDERKHDHAARGQQRFDVAVAEPEAAGAPDGVADDRGGEAVTSVCGCRDFIVHTTSIARRTRRILSCQCPPAAGEPEPLVWEGSIPPCPRCAEAAIKKDGKVGATQRYATAK